MLGELLIIFSITTELWKDVLLSVTYGFILVTLGATLYMWFFLSHHFWSICKFWGL